MIISVASIISLVIAIILVIGYVTYTKFKSRSKTKMDLVSPTKSDSIQTTQKALKTFKYTIPKKAKHAVVLQFVKDLGNGEYQELYRKRVLKEKGDNFEIMTDKGRTYGLIESAKLPIRTAKLEPIIPIDIDQFFPLFLAVRNLEQTLDDGSTLSLVSENDGRFTVTAYCPKCKQNNNALVSVNFNRWVLELKQYIAISAITFFKIFTRHVIAEIIAGGTKSLQTTDRKILIIVGFMGGLIGFILGHNIGF